MNLSEKMRGSFWLFDTAVFIQRFDVLDSPTAIFTDLSWSLSDRYLLPRVSELANVDKAMDLKSAWHEKGMFVEAEIPLGNKVPPSSIFPQSTWIGFWVNTRFAPGIQRGNENCTGLRCSLPLIHKKSPSTVGGFHWFKLVRSSITRDQTIDSNFAPVQVDLITEDRARVKFFVDRKCLPNFNPIEFPEIAFDVCVVIDNYACRFNYANTDPNGHNDNPSLWCRAKLVDRL